MTGNAVDKPMSLADEPTEQLRLRLEGLEHMAMMMAAESVPVSQDIADQLQTLQTELAKRTDIAPRPKAWSSWLGHEIENFSLQEHLSEGTYAHVFRAVHNSTGEECVFKIAKTPHAIGVSDNLAAKRAFVFTHEMVLPLQISPNAVIDLECQRLRYDLSGSFVQVLSSGKTEDCSYYRMPFLVGQSLRELAAAGDFPMLQYLLDIFRRLATLLTRLEEGGKPYHGNLQPDNIFITKTDVVLLSPGQFYIEAWQVGHSYNTEPFVISTPAYYPFYEPNDLTALGITLWECLCGKNPFLSADLPEREQLFSPEFKESLWYRKSLNHEPLWHILKLIMPRDARDDLNDESERFLLKSIKLTCQSDGLITACPGFENAKAFAEALERLSARGLTR